jgi:hypothetical protein
MPACEPRLEIFPVERKVLRKNEGMKTKQKNNKNRKRKKRRTQVTETADYSRKNEENHLREFHLSTTTKKCLGNLQEEHGRWYSRTSPLFRNRS